VHAAEHEPLRLLLCNTCLCTRCPRVDDGSRGGTNPASSSRSVPSPSIALATSPPPATAASPYLAVQPVGLDSCPTLGFLQWLLTGTRPWLPWKHSSPPSSTTVTATQPLVHTRVQHHRPSTQYSRPTAEFTAATIGFVLCWCSRSLALRCARFLVWCSLQAPHDTSHHPDCCGTCAPTTFPAAATGALASAAGLAALTQPASRCSAPVPPDSSRGCHWNAGAGECGTAERCFYQLGTSRTRFADPTPHGLLCFPLSVACRHGSVPARTRC